MNNCLASAQSMTKPVSISAEPEFKFICSEYNWGLYVSCLSYLKIGLFICSPVGILLTSFSPHGGKHRFLTFNPTITNNSEILDKHGIDSERVDLKRNPELQKGYI